jgi:acyl-CoA dehydrogenase
MKPPSWPLSITTTGHAEPPAHARLRDDVREFLREELGHGRWTPRADCWLTGWDEQFSARLAERGWVGVAIPARYGGRGAEYVERQVIAEELLAAGAPVAAHWIAERQTAPALLRYGTEEQRARFLPGITAGSLFFAIGMSEPDSGSDLASIRTRAIRVEGGGWSITGSKIWTSGAHRAQAMFVLARSGEGPGDGAPRRAQLSQFIVALGSPGVTVRPIRLLTGVPHFNEVVFDEVFVPDALVLGEIGNGWKQVTSELVYERSGPDRYMSTFVLLRALLALARDRDNAPADVRQVGSLVTQLSALRRMSSAVGSALADPALGAANLQAAVVKDLGTRYEGTVIDTAREIASPEANLTGGTEYERLLAEAVLAGPGFTLRGGTNEILRGIVARGMGLR